MTEIRHRVPIAAPPARVFQALTRAEDIRRWWMPHASLDPRIGGRGAIGFGQGRQVELTVTECEASRRFAWRVDAAFLADWVGTVVRFSVEPEGAGCILWLRHEGFASDADCIGLCTTGWGTHLQKLRALCEMAGDRPFVVRSIPGSPYGRAVLAVLEEKGLAYTIAPVAPGTLRSPAHLQRHPFGRIPVLEHGDFRLYETQAILRYLDRVAPAPPLTPDTPQAAARMDQLMGVADWYLFQGVANVIGFERIVGPRLLGHTPDEVRCAEAMPRALVVARELDRHLGERPYLTGERVSLADFVVAPHLDFLAQTPEWAAIAEAAPGLPAYLERMEARPSMQATTWAVVAARIAAPETQAAA